MRFSSSAFFTATSFFSSALFTTISNLFIASVLFNSFVRDPSSAAESDEHKSSISSFIDSILSHVPSTDEDCSIPYWLKTDLRKPCLAFLRIFFSCSFFTLSLALSSFSLESRSSFSFASLSSLSLCSLSICSCFSFFNRIFSCFSFSILSRSRFSLGSNDMLLSTNFEILAISSFFIAFAFLEISFSIHLFSYRQSAMSVSCSVSFVAGRVKSRQDSKCTQ
mmetsp:Transcript_3775/g.4313  ORF Transcript_3775/g.4313 Transcript_3775/m.4313 type:complete len:222 (+) Transcript_3775:424-1089(+)